MNDVKQYMVIETYKHGVIDLVYDRFFNFGRMLPEGLFFINSWLEKNGNRCFQLMETSDPSLFEKWIEKWADLVDFEIVAIGEKPKQS